MLRHSLVLSLVLALVGCSTPSAPPVAQRSQTITPSVATDPDVVQFQRMIEHLASPEMEGRSPGSIGALLARDWLVDQFKDAGLKPVFGDAYTQPFEVTAGVEVVKEKLHADGKAFADADDYDPFGTSASEVFEGEAVFVGYSINDKKRGYHSYPEDQAEVLKGKVLCIYRYEPTNEQGKSAWTEDGSWSDNSPLNKKVALAEKQGAAAIIVFNPPARRNAVVRSASGSVFGGTRDVPVYMASYGVFKRLVKRAGQTSPERYAELLEDKANAGATIVPLGVTLSGEVELKSVEVSAYNVAAVLPGSGELADQVVVIGAHYDHVGYGPVGRKGKKAELHPGADDNASGTAALVMLAQRFAARVESGRAPTNRRAILFVGFDAEERGLIGSAYFVDHLEQPGLKPEQMTAMLNMDMVGRMRDDKLHVGGVDSGDKWRKRVSTAGEVLGLKLTMSGPGGGRSDHANFYRIGVPVLHAFTGLHGDYHSPADTADKINAPGGVKVVDFMERLIDDLWAEPVTIAYVEPSKDGPPRAFLGIRPRLADRDGKNGAGIDAVTPDGPGQQAGLAEDDVIIGWDGKTVNNTTELMRRIRNAAPGDKVKLTVERGDETLKVDVELDGR